jgi:ArsR family transcriptional regulator
MPDDIQELKAAFFRALGNPVRIRILTELRKEPLVVSELQERLGILPSNLSQHLALLRAHRIVVGHREGNQIRYSLEERRIGEVLDAARAILERQVAESTRLLEAEASRT